MLRERSKFFDQAFSKSQTPQYLYSQENQIDQLEGSYGEPESQEQQFTKQAILSDAEHILLDW